MTYNDMDIDEMRELISYNPETGALVWLPRSWEHCLKDGGKRFNKVHAGKEAFRVSVKGYRQGKINRKSFRANRVAWALHYGEWPDGCVDHINGDMADNRIENLRVVSHAENCRNQPLRKNSKHEVMGIYQRNGKWEAFIMENGKQRHLGVFASKDDAIKARLEAQRSSGYHPNHGRLGTRRQALSGGLSIIAHDKGANGRSDNLYSSQGR